MKTSNAYSKMSGRVQYVKVHELKVTNKIVPITGETKSETSS